MIRTIIGGAQIIDLMILVVDIVKGVQTQTAECLVIGEITCCFMMVILNKVDLLPMETREASIQKMTKKMRATLSRTKFKDSPIIPVAAKCGGSDSTGPCESIGNFTNFLKFILKKILYYEFLNLRYDRNDRISEKADIFT